MLRISGFVARNAAFAQTWPGDPPASGLPARLAPGAGLARGAPYTAPGPRNVGALRLFVPPPRGYRRGPAGPAKLPARALGARGLPARARGARGERLPRGCRPPSPGPSLGAARSGPGRILLHAGGTGKGPGAESGGSRGLQRLKSGRGGRRVVGEYPGPAKNAPGGRCGRQGQKRGSSVALDPLKEVQSVSPPTRPNSAGPCRARRWYMRLPGDGQMPVFE